MSNIVVHIESILLASVNSINEQQNNLSSLHYMITQLSVHHNLWIVCNGAYSEAVNKIRYTLADLLSQEQILVYTLPSCETILPEKNKIDEHIIDYFINQFPAKLVLTITLNQKNEPHINIKRKNHKPSQHKQADKPSLAFFSPIPPAKTGIAGYSSELLPHLSNYYKITLVVNQTKTTTHKDITFPSITVDDFLQNPKDRKSVV